MGSIGHRWGTLAVVVGRVTTIQGLRESRTQGEGPEAWPFKYRTHTEVLDLMGDVTAEIGHLEKLAKEDPDKRYMNRHQ